MKRIAGLMVLGIAVIMFNICGTDEYGAEYREQISQLRKEIYTIPTNAENFRPRLELANKWYEISGDGFTTKMSPLEWEGFYRRSLRSEQLQDNIFKQLDEFLQKLDFSDGRGSEIATIRMESSDRALAGNYGTWTMVLTIGKLGIAEGGSITIHHMNNSDWGEFQVSRPDAANYVTVHTNANVRLEIDPRAQFRRTEGRTATRLKVTIRDGHLVEGDEVRIVFGDRSKGGPGRYVQTYSENDSRYYVIVDYQGNGIFCPVGWGAVNVEGAEPYRIVVVAPSIVRVGDRVPLRIRIEDTYRNFASDYAGTIQIKFEEDVIAEITMGLGNPPAKEIEITVPEKSGIIRYTAIDRVNNLVGVSNSIHVEEEPTEYLYWGELHGHTAIADGTGSIDEFYQFARDQAFCDFAALSEHDIWLTDKEWKMMRESAGHFYEPDNFVTLSAYEWTRGRGDGGGHHNVYFFGEDSPLLRSYDYRTKQELIRELESQVKDQAVIVIPHCHNPGDWRQKDPLMEKFVEIYSKHGSFEWFGNRFLEKNYLGFVCASDDHTGHPGNVPSGGWSQRGGLTGIYAKELTRKGLWDAMENKRAYGTTGARIFLDVRMDKHRMGERFSAVQVPELTADISGAAELAQIDVLRDGKVIHTEDFLRPEPDEIGETYLLLFSSSSDPQAYDRPLVNFWDVEIRVVDNRIKSFVPVGIDGQSDNLRQESSTLVMYRGTTRGERDGFLFEVEQPNRGRLELKSGDEKFQFSLKDLPDEGLTYIQEGGVVPSEGDRPPRIQAPGIVTLRSINSQHVLDYELRFTDPDPSPGEHYYYVRVTQVDDEQAWSSPIWVTQK